MALSDFYLKIDDIEGESKAKGHEDEMEILSFSLGASNTGSMGSGGLGAGKVNVSDATFMMKTCKASVRLFQACCKGTHFDEATFTCRKAGDEQLDFLVWTFKKLIITSFQQSGAGAGDDAVPTESFSIMFEEVEISYSPQKDDGSLDSALEYAYDIRTADDA